MTNGLLIINTSETTNCSGSLRVHTCTHHFSLLLGENPEWLRLLLHCFGTSRSFVKQRFFVLLDRLELFAVRIRLLGPNPDTVQMAAPDRNGHFVGGDGGDGGDGGGGNAMSE